MAGRALTGEQLAAYTRGQIRTAETLLAQHRAAGDMCSCGRAVPCPHAESLAGSLEHYRVQLALLERTQPLPVVLPAEAPRPAAAGRRRTLFARKRRKPRHGAV